MSKKRIGKRNIAIALGIICIILIVGLGVAMAYYDSYPSTHSHTNSEYDSLNNQKISLQNQVNDLTNIINLANSIVWVDNQTVSQSAGGGFGITWSYWTFSASYAGYVRITVWNSTTGNTHVGITWSSYGVDYDGHIAEGSSGTGVFPVLPCSNIEVKVGNTNFIGGATETVTITYYY